MVAYNRDIPDAPNNPSTDQPKMKQNTNAIDDLISVDHLTFQATNFGKHKQTSFEGFSAGTVPGGVPASVAYPAAGVATTARAQYYFKNSTNRFPLSTVRAWGMVTSAGALVVGQSFNVDNVALVGNTFTITLVANCTGSANYGVMVQDTTSAAAIFTRVNVLSTTQFTVDFVALVGFPGTLTLQAINRNFSFSVTQL